MSSTLETPEIRGGATTTEVGEGAAAIEIVDGVMLITMPSMDNQQPQPAKES